MKKINFVHMIVNTDKYPDGMAVSMCVRNSMQAVALIVVRVIALCAVLLAFALPLEARDFVGEFAAALRPDRCSLLVVDLAADTVVAEHNASLPLTPASITKALTSATTLRACGPDYRYHTRVYALGEVRDGVLEGDLLVQGGGDPSLGADCDPKGTDITAELAEALKRAGIREVSGRIITDSSFFAAPAQHPTWGSADKVSYYGTGCYGLNYRRNKTGKSAVANPADVLAREMATAMRGKGITLAGDTLQSAGRTLLFDHVSPPLGEIMRSCMMRSDNLYAEALLRTFAVQKGAPGATADGARLELDYWKGLGAPMQGVNVVDGSGLSRSNRLTANFLVYVLKQMADDEEYVSFFPLAGQEGTMRRMFAGSPLEGYVALKTGTMRGIRCLAGYMLDDKFAPTHAIVIISNDAPGGSQAVNSAAQRVLTGLFFPSAEESTPEEVQEDLTQ